MIRRRCVEKRQNYVGSSTGYSTHDPFCEMNSRLIAGVITQTCELGLENSAQTGHGEGKWALLFRGKIVLQIPEASLSRLRRLLGEFSGFTRITGQSDVFQRASNCISASVNWAPYGIVLADPRLGCILRPDSKNS